MFTKELPNAAGGAPSAAVQLAQHGGEEGKGAGPLPPPCPRPFVVALAGGKTPV